VTLQKAVFLCSSDLCFYYYQMDNSKNRHNDHLGVNKMGKNIRKSPLHQPNFANNPARQQPQPQVYNISKNDFRNIVQQLTGSPSHEPAPRPPNNLPKPPSMRLQKIRPPPLTPINLTYPLQFRTLQPLPQWFTIITMPDLVSLDSYHPRLCNH